MKITPEQAGTTETIGCDQKGSLPFHELLEDKQRLIKIGGIAIGVILLIAIIYHMGSTPTETTDTNQKTEVTTEKTVDTETTNTPVDAQKAEESETKEGTSASENAEAKESIDEEDTDVVVETPPTTPR